MLLLVGGVQSGLGEGHTLSSPECGDMHCYTVPGRVGARNVVLIHGWSATAKLNWEKRVVPALHGYNVAAFDNIGHGRSAHGSYPSGEGYLEACADRIAAGMELLGFAEADIVGWSKGGAIAQLLCRRHPELVQRLFLGGAAAQYPQPDVLKRPFQVAEAVLERVPSSVRRVAAHATDLGLLDGVPLLRETARNDPLAFVQAGAAIYHFDSRSWVGQLGVPTTVFITEHDQLVSVERQTELLRLIPGAREYPIHSKLGHFAPITEEFAIALRSCIDRGRTRRPARRTPAPIRAVA